MWFWRIIKGVLYDLFVRIWFIGMTVVTLLVFYGIMIVSAFMREGYIFFGILAILIFAGGFVYIVYWYFSNHHYILGSLAILVCFAVIYIVFIEPYITPADIEETAESVAALARLSLI